MDGNATNTIIMVFFGIAAIGIVGIIIAYIILKKKSQNTDVVRIENLRKGTEERNFSWEVFYQRLYIRYLKTPFIKTYLLKIRRRLEINNIDDEFTTRNQAAQIVTKALCVIIPLTLIVIILTRKNILLMTIIFIFELFIIDSFTDGLVNKIDNRLLAQQVDFFAQMRHSYHENSMVAEAIYATAQESENIEISRQAEQIYNILNSSDPENELEKYYDIAPNNYLREFAGISYLTQEFGDRKLDNGESLYLSNLENITKEMQLEILKRDKLDYTFRSLSFIAIAPTVLLEPLKTWAVGNFSFTKSFYNGNKGMLLQVVIMVLTMICYILIRKLKDNGSTKQVQNGQNPWQEKLYKTKFIKKIIDLLMPKRNTKEYRKLERLLKDAGSKQKIRWIYVNKVLICIGAFISTIVLFISLHNIQIRLIYNEPTVSYNLIGELSTKDEKKAMEKTKRQNIIIDKLRGKQNISNLDIEKAMRNTKEYKNLEDKDITSEAKDIKEKLDIVNKEYLKWFEVLIAMSIAYIAYLGPVLLLKFQVKMRQMEMEDEVMSYHTIIMMLMRIERVDVEMILEWLERYSDIFKEQIGKCLNNYESGAWEALEEMKTEVSYQPFIRLIESLQSSVEKVSIRAAFEELDSDRDYYQDKRKETNERLISKRGLIGKAIGFAPMVVTFIGYLIIPLVFIGMTSMMTSFDSMSSSV